MRAIDRDLIRGGHYGQRPRVPHFKGRTHGCTDQCCIREENPCQLGAVHTWHFADNSVAPAFVRYWRVTADNVGFWPELAWSLMTHKRHWLCTAAMFSMSVSAPIKVRV